MNRNALASDQDPLFKSENPQLLKIWDSMQRLQTDFCVNQELSAYYLSPQWLNAQTVLDLGTGNGYYLNKIVSQFPNKHYLGVDSSAEFIDVAIKDFVIENVAFKHADLIEETGRYDFIIMRLLLQHLSDIPSTFEHLARITDGSVLVIDAYDPFRYFSPPLPQFMAFFQAYTNHEASQGRRRDVSVVLMDYLKSNSEWTVASAQYLLIPSTIHGNLDSMRKNYALLIDLLETVGDFDYDYNSVREEWNWWCGLDRAYTQVGLMLLRLDRVV